SSGAPAYEATSTPLGISTASEPSASICQRLARSDTAIRPTIFSCQGRSTPWNTVSVSDLVVEVWKVATIGPSATRRAHIDRLGALGSCRCKTSKSPSASQRLTRPCTAGLNCSRATEPLYGIGIARPAETTYSGSDTSGE